MQEQGPFDRILQSEPRQERDRTATFIVGITIALGLLLFILVIPPISILGDSGGSGEIGLINTAARTELPAPPEGFEAVSALYDVTAQNQYRGPATLRFRLSTTLTEGTSLEFFTYLDDDERWRRIGTGTVLAGGVSVEAELPILPPNVAVLRPSERTHLILGSLPTGEELDPAAAGALTTLTIGGFTLAPNGAVSGAPPTLPDDLLTPVAPTISALSESEIEALQTVLASPELRAAHAQSVLDLVDTGGYAGVELAYRINDTTLEDEFVELVTAISAGLHANGRTLILTLPLPERQSGEWNTLGFDWAALAPHVDAIKLTTIQNQSRFYQQMEDALTYLTSRVTSSKLILPVGSRSYEDGALGIRTLALIEALTIASAPIAQPQQARVSPESTVHALGQNISQETGGSVLRWDDAARAVVFSYAGLGGQRTVWIANVFSATFKLELAERFQLGGIAIEDVSQAASDSNVWPAVQQYADGDAVELVLPNGALLVPQWTATAGALESASGSSTNWVAPAESGSYSITLVVSDGVIRIGQRLVIEVAPPQGVTSP